MAIVTSTDPYSMLIADTFREEHPEGRLERRHVREGLGAALGVGPGPRQGARRQSRPGREHRLAGDQDLAAFTKQFVSVAHAVARLRAVRPFHARVPRADRRRRQRRPLVDQQSACCPTRWARTSAPASTKTYGVEDGLQHRRRHLRPGHDVGAARPVCAGDADDYPAVVKQIRNGHLPRHRRHLRTSTPRTTRRMPYPAFYNDPSLGMPLLSYQIQNGQQVVHRPVPVPHGRVPAAALLHVSAR